jgi:small-conductance mechanosensitive channel/CRP-like cAMP-binding protein
MITHVIGHLWRDETPYVLGAATFLAALVYYTLSGSRTTLKHSLLFLGLWFAVDAVAAIFSARGEARMAAAIHQAALLGLGLVLIRLSGLALFRVLLPRLNVKTPRILEDIVVIGGYVLWAMVRMAHIGVDLSSLVATSAVITAVVAFAMQDTLGNILGGLALQLDNSLEIGDWVKLDDLSGRVVEIQWRYTAILTRNGEKVVVPNSQLMKGKFTVLLDPDLGVTAWRRWVWFNVDYSVTPALVISAVERAVAEAEIENVSKSPAPSCVAMDFVPGSVRYAVRYWLLDPQNDDPTDSAVRVHVLTALQRSGWRVALPDQVVHLVKEDEAYRERVEERDLQRRLAALAGVELFAELSDAERQMLAGRLSHAPFARGAVMTHQGAVAHWLYLITSGEADVIWVAPNGEKRLLTTIPAGSVFGEMSLMTGAPRSATVVARSDVECYRLDKSGFEDIIRARPELAESMAHILAIRMQQIDELQTQYHREKTDAEHAQHRADIVKRIRDFFGLK